MPFHEDNHYVPCVYLKRWASSDGRIWTYRILAPHPRVRLWSKHFPRAVAYHQHLYTRVVAGQETDEIEQWLASKFEAPAAEALRKATSDARLTPDDWKQLVRFLAAQQVRTPGWFAKQARHWHAVLPGDIGEALRSSVRLVEEAAQSGHPLPASDPATGESPPFRITVEHEQSQETARLGVEVPVGRKLWLWGIQYALKEHLHVLHQHKWTILLPPKGLAWFTSDDPVVRLNFHSPTKYNFDGGWGSQGTEIFLPLGPQHLLYTRIGKRPRRRGERMTQAEANLVRRFIAEHAHRMIFAAECDAEVPRLHPPIVDADRFRREQKLWSTWHDQQTAAEQELIGGAENSERPPR
jgi:Protein of unknown function (DUF4238)